MTPLIVFADDWGRHPSSCQHLTLRFLDAHPVHWVNTIGMRPPRLNLDTVRRAAGVLKSWVRPPKATAADAGPTPTVHRPRMWPWFRTRTDRRINRLLLTRFLGRLVERLPEPPVVVTTLPIVADLLGRVGVRRWVYYCVDDFSEWPGLDAEPLRRMEAQLLQNVDDVICVSETLRDRLAALGRPSSLLTHGVDLAFWSSPRGVWPGEGWERPWVVFWGVIDRRMDVTYVRSLTAALDRGTLIFVGPESDPDPELKRLPRTAFPGPRPFDQLPDLGAAADVLVMPYADLPVTRAMQPLKLKEYLATGKPVVASDLPSNREWADCLDLAAGPEAFARLVTERLEHGVPREQAAARSRLAAEGWDAKAETFRRRVFGEERNEA